MLDSDTTHLYVLFIPSRTNSKIKNLKIDKMSKKTQEKSLLQIQLENEAKVKEILDRDQIRELNQAMVDGKDLNKAAKNIFGPNPNQKRGNSNEMKVKKPDQMNYDARNFH